MKYIGIFVLISFFQLFFSSEIKSINGQNKSIEIIIPAKGSTVDCTKTKSGKKANFTVKGSSSNLQEGEYITMFLRPKNEKRWYRISDSAELKQSYSASWFFNIDAEISKKCKVAELSAFVSSVEITDPYLDDVSVRSNQNILCHSQEDFIIIAQ